MCLDSLPEENCTDPGFTQYDDVMTTPFTHIISNLPKALKEVIRYPEWFESVDRMSASRLKGPEFDSGRGNTYLDCRLNHRGQLINDSLSSLMFLSFPLTSSLKSIKIY